MFRYLIFCFFVSSFFSSAYAYLSNEECTLAYRDGAVELRETAQDFNEKLIDRFDMSLEVSRISAQVNAQRLACRVVQDPNTLRCIQSAKSLYESVRNEINLRSIGFGNQTEVRLYFDFRAKLAFHDLRCL